jgi:hypothetical protein
MNVRKHSYQHTLLAQEDRVIASAPLAYDGGKFLGMSGVVHAVAGSDENIAHAVMLMARGIVGLFVRSDYNADDADELWDTLAPKDEALSSNAGLNQIDTSFQTEVETETFSEPGLPSPTVLSEGSAIHSERIFDYSKIMTFADTSDGFKAGSPDTFRPNVTFRTDSNKQVTMGDSVPGYVLLALGTPALTSTTATVPNLLDNKQMVMMKHLHQLLEDSWKQFAGLDETSAESPFLDIAQLIIELTEPTVIEESGGAWGAAAFNCWSETWIDTHIPYDSVVPTTLTAG